MDSTTLYRPTLEEQSFFDEVRRHIDKNRDDFREAGQWLETEYAFEQVDQREREGRPGDPANYQQAQEEREQQSREAGYRPKERSPESVLFVRLIGCAQDILHDQPDVTNYERNERLPLVRRIIFVTWLLTDPDAAELKLGFTTLETMPWGGDWRVDLLGRSMVRDDILLKGWMELAHPAWQELGHAATSPNGNDDTEQFVPTQDDIEILRVLEKSVTVVQVGKIGDRLPNSHPLGAKAIALRLVELEKARMVRRPHGVNSGVTTTDKGLTLLKSQRESDAKLTPN